MLMHITMKTHSICEKDSIPARAVNRLTLHFLVDSFFPAMLHFVKHLELRSVSLAEISCV